MDFWWKNGELIAQSNETYWIFENVNTTSNRTKNDSFIYCETLPNYAEERVLITVSWQGYSLNMVFLQGYRKAEDAYFIKNMTTKKN